ncbi:MAG TPA: hypothetical protein VNB54_13220 [Alphaproteobacteria bacterium]|nr:hypothetical protein [Alphaproteobacteria bacterium]
MTNAWSNAFTTRTPADARQGTHGNSRQGRGVAATIGTALMFLVLVLAPGNLVLAQELDSSTLQKEAEEEAAAKAKQSQELPASQAQPPQAANPQDRPEAPQPQFSQPPTIAPQAQMPQPYPAQPGQPTFMLPPGTKLPLGLLRPLKLKAGRDIYLQITFPVTVGNQMVIPPGTYIQGVVEKVIRKDRRRERLEFSIRSANMIFLNGYTAPITGTVNIATTNAALQAPPRGSDGQPAAAMAAVGGVAPPALPPLPPLPDIGKTARTAMIAIGVVGAVAVTTAIVLAARSDPYVEVGTPLEIVLPVPLFLDAGRVMVAVQQFNQQASNAPVQIVQPPVKPRICYDPGSPGTPDTIIPGSPGTPDTVIPGVNGMPDTVIPGSPRTPDTVIPGTPGTPSSSYPCPR